MPTSKEYAVQYIRIALQGFQATGAKRAKDADELRQILEKVDSGGMSPDEGINKTDEIYEANQDLPTQEGREYLH